MCGACSLVRPRPETVQGFVFAVSEATTNAVMHGWPPVRVRVWSASRPVSASRPAPARQPARPPAGRPPPASQPARPSRHGRPSEWSADRRSAPRAPSGRLRPRRREAGDADVRGRAVPRRAVHQCLRAGRRPPRGGRAPADPSPAAAARAAVAAVVWAVTGARSLTQEAERTAIALDADDLETARAVLPGLCSRDPAQLGAKEIARAVVESVAELGDVLDERGWIRRRRR